MSARPISILCLHKIDSGSNPYLRLLAENLRACGVEYKGWVDLKTLWKGDFDALHVHWPEHIFNPGRSPRSILQALSMFGGIWFCKLRGKPMIWTMHNLKPHEDRRFWGTIMSPLTQFLTAGLVYLSEYGRGAADAAYARLRRKPFAVIRHGHYREILGALPDRTAATALLREAISRPTLSFLGMIKPYKGLLELVRIFKESAPQEASLLIAGEISIHSADDFRKAIINETSSDQRIHTWFERVPDEKLAMVARASDAVILPYKNILNSGVALFALSCDRRVCAPRLGSLPELQADVGSDWVHLYDPPLDNAALSRILTWASAAHSDKVDLSLYDWPAIANAHRDFFESLARH
jgi:beta-1,4-mannosyltransferase